MCDYVVRARRVAHIRPRRRYPVNEFRDCLATVVSYIWFNRSDTTHSLRNGDLTVDPDDGSPDRQIRLLPRQRKGKKRQALSAVKAISIPVAAHPQLAEMLRVYSERRAAAWEAVGPVHGSPYQLWALPGDTPSRWTSAVQNAWLASALRQVQLAPPAGYSWTSHSLRSGAASAARAIGVALEVIRYFGHWARNSDTVRDYIDPTFRPSLAASFFFGWLSAMPATDEAE